MPLFSSGATKISTTNNDAVDVLVVTDLDDEKEAVIVNEGEVEGVLQHVADGQTVECPLPAGATVTINVSAGPRSFTLRVRRIADGDNVTDVWAIVS